MVDRIYASASRVAISKPGYDVKTAPISTDYLAVDSSFGMPLRVLMAGVRYNLSINQFAASPVPYGTTYSIIPKVLVTSFTPGGAGASTVWQLFQKRLNGSAHANLWFNPFNIQMTKSNFYITRNDGYEGVNDFTYYDSNRHWIYIVFPP